MRGKVLLGNIALTVCLLAGIAARAQEAALDAAATAFEQGKTALAEQQVRAVLDRHANDLRALILMGAILDSEQRYADAAPYYERALRSARQP